MTVDRVAVCLDVLIVGAGLSGLGAAYYLQKEHPAKSWAMLEARAAIGGTWDLFRYPGVRSDSDLHTFGYAFKPWIHRQAIADAPDILAYLRQVATENGMERKLHLRHKAVGAAWSSADALWTVDVERLDTGVREQMLCRWLFCAAGYYCHDQGHAPRFEGLERFQGLIVHPQHWPEALDWAGKRVLVIGSGATAVTLVPAMAAQAAHVTMLQRTPSLNLQLLGGMRLCVDGELVNPSRKLAFKGMMLDGIPNFVFAMGYTHASWTLKVGLLCAHFCRLLSHMDQKGHAICRPERPSADMATRPLWDFGAGYVQRALGQLPRQGLDPPWVVGTDYQHDAWLLGRGPVQDPCLRFTGRITAT